MPRMMLVRVLAIFAVLVTGAMLIFNAPNMPSDEMDATGEDGIPTAWHDDFPKADFTTHSVPLTEIKSGGPQRDVIPAIRQPVLRAVDQITPLQLPEDEPVIGLVIGGEARAYPLRIMLWHEIANDVVGGVPVAVTYCPLCNSAIVFDRRVDGKTLEFGVTGRLRKSDMIMYDHQTESWWQQFTGEAIVGTMTGKTLDIVPARLESFANFKARTANGRVLVPEDPGQRDYGENPYEGYDKMETPPLYDGPAPAGIAPLARVVTVGDQAWALDLLAKKGRIVAGDLVLTWEPGQRSVLDAPATAFGHDVGNAVVRRQGADGELVDVAYGVSFAFAFLAFHPDGVIHTE